MPPEGNLIVRHHQADIRIKQTQLSHGRLRCTGGERKIVHLLDGLTRCEGICGDARRALLFTSYVSDPRALCGICRKAIYRAPAFAVWTPKIIDLGFRKGVTVGERYSGDVLRVRVNRFHEECSAVVAVPCSLTLRTELALQRVNELLCFVVFFSSKPFFSFA